MATTSAPDQPAPAGGPAEQPPAEPRRRPRWAAPAVLAGAAVVIAVAAVVGIRGLLADPVTGTDAGGVATLDGSFDPFDCTGQSCPAEGYVSAGGRKVFVILPGGCPRPDRGAHVVVRGRLDPSQGRQTYRALDCGSR